MEIMREFLILDLVKLYRFERLWLKKAEECKDVVAHSWILGDDVMHHLTRVGSNLNSWGKAAFG